ncbi:MAG: type II toxin-antitoxin system prevent-host-death family antitoxin [Pseudomonadota bacterium]
MNVAATELKNRLGQYLEVAQREPVIVEKSGRVSNVLLSKVRYDALCEIEGRFERLMAQDAQCKGFLSDAETQRLLDLR